MACRDLCNRTVKILNSHRRSQGVARRVGVPSQALGAWMAGARATPMVRRARKIHRDYPSRDTRSNKISSGRQLTFMDQH